MALPAVLTLAGLAIGIVLDAVMARFVRRAAGRGASRAEAVARAARGLPTLLCGSVGLWLALTTVDLEEAPLDALTTIVKVVAVIGTTVVASRLAGVLVEDWIASQSARLPSSTIFVNLARGAAVVAGGLIALSAAGYSIAPLLAGLGVAGLAVGLALQDTLGNLFSGIQILLSRQLEPGDVVRLESGEEGWVHDVTWRNTTIRLFTNDLLVVPNAKLGTSLVTNFSTLDAQHIVWVEAGVAYASDLERVERLTLQVAREVQREKPGSARDFEPALRYTAFGDSSIRLRVSVRAEQYQDRWLLTHEMVKRLHRRYAEEGIEIPFPQRDVHIIGGTTGTRDLRTTGHVSTE